MKALLLFMIILVACNVQTKQEQQEQGYQDNQGKSTSPKDYSQGTRTEPHPKEPEPGYWMGH